MNSQKKKLFPLGNNSQSKIQDAADGFTLIELLVVIAVIALLSSIVLIGLQNARQKSRDVKRLSDMTQMASAMELYFNTNKGYPSSTIVGQPDGLVPTTLIKLPNAPLPADGGCDQIQYPNPVPAGTYATVYYYYPSGTSYLAADNVTRLYTDYAYFFCLGNQTGAFTAGIHQVTSKGVK